MTQVIQEYILPEAPKYHEKERHCSKDDCNTKVSAYQSSMLRNDSVVLCFRCQDRFAVAQVNDSRLTLNKFIGRSRPRNSGKAGERLPGLKRVRELRGLSRVELQDAAGINKDTIRKYERNEMGAYEDKIVQLCDALGCSKDELTS